MLPINEYQKLLYEVLSSTGYKVFDEVPKNEELPLITIGDYTLSEGNNKNDNYVFNQQINVFSSYEGKMEINEMVSNILEVLKGLVNTDIDEAYFFDHIRLQDSSITREDESVYMANLNFLIYIDEVI